MSQDHPHLTRGIICALAGGICWGFSANCAEVLMVLYDVPVLWMTPVRMACSAAFFLVFSLARHRTPLMRALRDPRGMLHLISYGIFGILLMQVTYLYAIEYAGAGTALTLEQIALVFIMLYVCVKGRRLPKRRELLGIFFAFIGVVFIATQGDITTLNVPLIALVWGLASAATMALYNILPLEPLKRFGTPVVNGIGMFFGALVCAVFTQPWSTEIELPPEGWLVFLGLIVIGTIVAYFLYVQGIKDAGPMRASLLACSEPVAGTFISALWIGTPITVWDLLGLAAIIVMVFLETQRDGEG